MPGKKMERVTLGRKRCGFFRWNEEKGIWFYIAKYKTLSKINTSFLGLKTSMCSQKSKMDGFSE